MSKLKKIILVVGARPNFMKTPGLSLASMERRGRELWDTRASERIAEALATWAR